jgi:hypothetical protein
MFYAERFPDPTRALSPRQLPTDHVPAVPTREYQSDQSSRQLLGCHLPCYPKQKGQLLSLSRKAGLDFKPSNRRA